LLVPHIVGFVLGTTRCVVDMAGLPRVASTTEQLEALQELSRSDRRDEADRARAIVLSVNGWTSGQIARAFGVTPDSVRRWRSWFAEAGVEGLRARERTGREAVKSDAAASVVASLLTAPVADRTNWTLPRLQAEIARQTEVSISKSQLSKTLKKTATDGAGRATLWPVGKIPMPSIAPGSGSKS
jgi:transposase